MIRKNIHNYAQYILCTVCWSKHAQDTETDGSGSFGQSACLLSILSFNYFVLFYINKVFVVVAVVDVNLGLVTTQEEVHKGATLVI